MLLLSSDTSQAVASRSHMMIWSIWLGDIIHVTVIWPIKMFQGNEKWLCNRILKSGNLIYAMKKSLNSKTQKELTEWAQHPDFPKDSLSVLMQVRLGWVVKHNGILYFCVPQHHERGWRSSRAIRLCKVMLCTPGCMILSFQACKACKGFLFSSLPKNLFLIIRHAQSKSETVSMYRLSWYDREKAGEESDSVRPQSKKIPTAWAASGRVRHQVQNCKPCSSVLSALHCVSLSMGHFISARGSKCNQV